MAFDFMKRGVLALLLRGIREHLRRVADQQTRSAGAQVRIADALELLLKLEAMKADLSLEALKEAEEGEPAAAESAPPAQIIADQSPEELDRLEHAFEHAETHLGRGKNLDGLDLYGYAATLEPDNAEERP